MRKLTRTMLRSITLKILKEQDYICPVCGLKIDPTIKGEAVCDHDHNTGQVRGVLHRSCNAALGKMDNAVGRWGAKRQGMMTVPHGINDCMALAEECLDNYFCQDFVTLEANLLRLKKENPVTTPESRCS